MKVRCLIVEDEPLAADVIQQHLARVDMFELVHICQNAFDAFNYLRKYKIDLLFLDIHMPEMKGTELLKGLNNPPKVIITTAYREYALEGYELNVLDYLLKPISFDRFMQAVNKYFDSCSINNDLTYHENNSNHAYIYVREKNQVHKVTTENISYIESIGDYIKIHNHRNSITIRSTISSLEEMLPASDFLRIHRSFIININQISRFTAHSVFINDQEFPVGPSYRKSVFKVLHYPGFK